MATASCISPRWGPDLPPPHRRHGELLLVLPPRRRQRRRGLREREHRRIRRIPAAGANDVRRRHADQCARRAAAAVSASARHPLANPAAYVGRYSGPRALSRFGRQSADDRRRRASAPLQYWGGEIFRTTNPPFAIQLLFERPRDRGRAASWGPAAYLGKRVRAEPAVDPALARLAGRYVNDSPWLGIDEVVERGGQLWFGTEMPMTRIGDNLWRVGARAGRPSARPSPTSSAAARRPSSTRATNSAAHDDLGLT